MGELQRPGISFSRDISPLMASVQRSPLNQKSWGPPVCLAVVRVLASQFISLHRYLQRCWDWNCAPHWHISRAEKETLNPSMIRVWYVGWPDHWCGWEAGAGVSSFCESPPLSAACCFSPGDFPWHHSHPTNSTVLTLFRQRNPMTLGCTSSKMDWNMF